MEISLARNLFTTLIFHAIQRCRAAETLCRVSISLKTIHQSNNPRLIHISISDTGIGSKLEEFQRLDIRTHANSCPQWDGKLSITTTGINDKEIQHFCLNLREAPFSEKSLVKLPSTYKNSGIFSGSEASFSIQEEANCEDLVLWAVGFLRKVLILRNPNILFGLSLDQIIEGQVLKRERLVHENNETHVPFTLGNIECMSFGLKEFLIKHGLDKECEFCSTHREVLMEGKGVASNSEKNRIKDQIRVEVVILIAPIIANHSCWAVNSPTSQVLCYEDYMPVLKLESCLDVISSIDWQYYGLKLKNSIVENEGKIILEWDYTSFARMDIIMHCYHKSAILVRDISVPDRNLMKKAIKSALDELKASHANLFLSRQSMKIREYVPDLSRALSDLILSSNDSQFKGECAEILGLTSLQSNRQETLIESCISEKLTQIIESNDSKSKSGRTGPCGPSLFNCENELFEEEIEENDDDYLLGY